MNRLIALALLLFFFSSTSCTVNFRDDTFEEYLEKTLTRVAAVEHQFSDPAQCTAAARAYAGKAPEPISRDPLIYSFCEGCEVRNNPKAKEVRFVVQEAGSGGIANNTIYFREVKRKFFDTNRGRIKKVFDELTEKYNCGVIRRPIKDGVEVNDDEAWRAVLKRPEGLTRPEEAAMKVRVEQEFGIIINPPFP